MTNSYDIIEYKFKSFTKKFYLNKIIKGLNNIFNLYKKNIKQNAFGTSVDILTISVESEVNGFASVSSTILWDEV